MDNEGKTIVISDWQKTMVRYADPGATVLLDSGKTITLPPTVAFLDNRQQKVSDISGDDELFLIVRNVLEGNVEFISRYLRPLNYSFREDDQIGEYSIICKLGEGSFSKVYKVRHTLKKNIEAVKILKTSTLGEMERKTVLERFFFEYSTGQIESDHVLRCKDKGFVYGHPFIVYEIADGGDLGQLKAGNLEIDLINHISKDVLRGLKDIHSLGIVHRDIKPQNIFLCRDRFKLGDFGVSASLEKAKDGTDRDRNIYGTYGYLAPELLSEHGDPGPSLLQDIFSFGCMLFQFITGALPFGRIANPEDIRHYLYNCRNAVFRPIRQYRKDIPTYWEDIIYGCLQAEPKNRIGSAGEILDILRRNTQKTQRKDGDFESTMYKYDYIFSFPERNRFLAIELIAYLRNQGVKITLNSDIFPETEKGDLLSAFKEARYHLLLLTGESDRSFIEKIMALPSCDGLVIYGDEGNVKHFEGRDNIILAESKYQILKLVYGWKEENEAKETKYDGLKIELLNLIAKNKLDEVVRNFLAHLNSGEGNNDVKSSLYLLSSRIKSLKTKINNGVISNEDARREENQIILSLNGLIFDYF